MKRRPSPDLDGLNVEVHQVSSAEARQLIDTEWLPALQRDWRQPQPGLTDDELAATRRQRQYPDGALSGGSALHFRCLASPWLGLQCGALWLAFLVGEDFWIFNPHLVVTNLWRYTRRGVRIHDRLGGFTTRPHPWICPYLYCNDSVQDNSVKAAVADDAVRRALRDTSTTQKPGPKPVDGRARLEQDVKPLIVKAILAGKPPKQEAVARSLNKDGRTVRGWLAAADTKWPDLCAEVARDLEAEAEEVRN